MYCIESSGAGSWLLTELPRPLVKCIRNDQIYPTPAASVGLPSRASFVRRPTSECFWNRPAALGPHVLYEVLKQA